MTMEYLPMLALERVFNGRDHMVPAGTEFLATARRAAGLIAVGAAVIRYDEADEEALEAVAALRSSTRFTPRARVIWPWARRRGGRR